jgi:alkylation response protein AidB-like acyl-CoA dehydrogenase
VDTSFSPEDIAFRDEVRAFFDEAFTDDLRDRIRDSKQYRDAIVDWQRNCTRRGWVAPNWPVEYGGTGWTPTQKYIYDTRAFRARYRDTVPFGLKMVAPVIYTFGNEEQKQRFLPRILKSEDWWCQGYSEPGSGSDLASLKTRAELDGDHYVVNGAKIWTTYAQHADWIFCLVRTST